MARPFLLGQQSGATGRSATDPLPTIATSGAIALVDPSLIVYNGTGETSPVDRPVPTITTKDRFGLVSPTAEPFLTKHYGTSSVGSVEDPVPTVTAGGGHIGIVRPFLVPQFGEAAGQLPRVHAVEQPLQAVTGHGAGALVQPTIVQMMNTSRQDDGVVRSVDVPLPTFTTKKCLAIAEPTLTHPDGEVDPRRLLWIGDQLYVLDIKFRMLRNRELAKAMGFDDDVSEYQFSGTVEQVTKQIGNAVCVNLAAALVQSILGEQHAREGEASA
jgi:DNA (cytosine-5)-methyltransferase 1